MAFDLKRSPWALPLFLTQANKNRIGIVTFLVAGSFYVLSNQFHLTPPELLPMWAADRAVPFIPETVWIYISEYLFFVAVYVSCRDMVNANKYLYSFLALQVVSVGIFVAWPTTFPRELFPLPEDLDRFTYFAFHTLRQSDTPANCCPSLHVSSVFLSTYIFLDDQRRKFPFFFIWGLLIAASTLSTKQHYLVDIIAGFLMSVLFYWVFHRLIPYRALQAKR